MIFGCGSGFKGELLNEYNKIEFRLYPVKKTRFMQVVRNLHMGSRRFGRTYQRHIEPFYPTTSIGDGEIHHFFI